MNYGNHAYYFLIVPDPPQVKQRPPLENGSIPEPPQFVHLTSGMPCHTPLRLQEIEPCTNVGFYLQMDAFFRNVSCVRYGSPRT